MSADLSGEITAIATAVLAAFAIVTAWYARGAFRAQAQEVSAIQKQVKDQEDAQLRSQAVKVTAWLEGLEHDGSWKAHIHNASDQCIFDVRTSFHEIRKKPGTGWEPMLIGEPPPRDETICVFPPRSHRFVTVPEKVRALFHELTDRTCVVSIEFTDAAENQWERDPRGAIVPRS